METFLAALEGSALAQALRFSRWGYAWVNAAHVLGIALLVGAILPLDLRLLGAWRDVPRASLVRVLAPVAAAGLGLAVVTGALLFSTRATDYADVGFLQMKLSLAAIGLVSALWVHAAHGPTLEGARRGRLAAHAAVSAFCWLGALVCGRMIAFAE